MVVIEMRDNAYDAAFELLEEAKHSAKKTKLTLCELEDAMYDCYETSKEDYESYDSEEPEIDFRGRSSYRHDDRYGVREDDDAVDMRYRRSMGRRGGLRMRRNRMGRFV
jgi:hypothetical protein